MMRALLLTLAITLCAASVHAQGSPLPAEDFISSPYDGAVRRHYYDLLSRSPTKSFLWELALPGAGHVYTGFYVQAALSATLTITGASLWIAGAARDNDALWWAGAATFGAGRLYGLISAPVSAALLNAAYRRQLGIRVAY